MNVKKKSYLCTRIRHPTPVGGFIRRSAKDCGVFGSLT